MTSITNDPHYWEQYEQINCWYCGVRLYHNRHIFRWVEDNHKWAKHRTVPEGWKRFTWDHAVPTSRGGSNAGWNLVPSCDSCNCSKNGKTVQEFRQYKTKKLQASSHFFWIEKEIGQTIPDFLTIIHIEELETQLFNDKRLMKDYQTRANQKEANVVRLTSSIQDLKGSLGKDDVA